MFSSSSLACSLGFVADVPSCPPRKSVAPTQRRGVELAVDLRSVKPPRWRKGGGGSSATSFNKCLGLLSLCGAFLLLAGLGGEGGRRVARRCGACCRRIRAASCGERRRNLQRWPHGAAESWRCRSRDLLQISSVFVDASEQAVAVAARGGFLLDLVLDAVSPLLVSLRASTVPPMAATARHPAQAEASPPPMFFLRRQGLAVRSKRHAGAGRNVGEVRGFREVRDRDGDRGRAKRRIVHDIQREMHRSAATRPRIVDGKRAGIEVDAISTIVDTARVCNCS